jgi:hypothetical protein
MKAIDETKTQEINKELEDRFKSERDDWNKKMFDVIDCIKDNRKLTEAQVIQLSYRQIIQDKLAEYRILCDKRQESYDKVIQKRSDEYENQSARKVSAVDKKVSLSGDYASLNRQIKLISRQIMFLEETVKTLDNLGFAIKNKIEIVSNQLV